MYKTSVILCGGKGSRLGELGKNIPKTLLKVQGKPIIWYILMTLKRFEFNHVILALGHKKEKIQDYLSKNKKNFKDLKIECINTGKSSTIAERIFKIKNKIKSQNFILLNSDSIFDFNLKKIFELHQKKKLDLSLVTTNIQADFGSIIIKNNKVINFQRDVIFNTIKLNKDKNLGKVYSGIAIMNNKILKYRFKKFKNFEKEFYPKVISYYKCDHFSPYGFWKGMDNIKQVNDLNDKNNVYLYSSVKKIKNKLEKFNDK